MVRQPWASTNLAEVCLAHELENGAYKCCVVLPNVARIELELLELVCKIDFERIHDRQWEKGSCVRENVYITIAVRVRTGWEHALEAGKVAVGVDMREATLSAMSCEGTL